MLIMDASAKKKEDSRVEFRVSAKDKELFDHAKTLSGFTSFSEFVRHVLTNASREIVGEHNKILASEKDREIFFNALMGKEEGPNAALMEAIEYYEKLVKE
jgi:uncharacterized protein (DUF1778 family)